MGLFDKPEAATSLNSGPHPVVIAEQQRVVLRYLLVNLVFTIAFGIAFGLIEEQYLQLSIQVGWGIVCIINLLVLSSVFRLAREINGTAAAMIVCILNLVPPIFWILLLIVNSQANRIMRAHGLRVGLLGVGELQRRQWEDKNTDSRWGS